MKSKSKSKPIPRPKCPAPRTQRPFVPNPGNPQQLMVTAMQYHQMGMLKEAESCYRQILQQQPTHAEVWHLLGVVVAQTGRPQEAIDYITKAITVKATVAAFHSNLGNIFQALGRFDEALTSHQKALRRAAPNDPGVYNTYNSLGVCWFHQNRLSEAVTSFQRSLRVNPQQPATYNHLANVLVRQDKLEEAIINYRQAIGLHSTFADAYAGLGQALQASNQQEEGIAACRYALQLNPNLVDDYIDLAEIRLKQQQYTEARDYLQKALQLAPKNPRVYFDLGLLLSELNDLTEAMANYHSALQLNPAYAEAYNNLGILLQRQNQLAEAGAHFEKAIALNPSFVVALHNWGRLLEAQDKLEEARGCYQRMIVLKPNDGGAHLALAFILFKTGHFAQAWTEYEWRLVAQQEKQEFPIFKQPPWDGTPLAGRRLLVHWEQGFGDILQFVRYLPLITGGTVIFACLGPLQTLLRNLPGVDQLIISQRPFSSPYPDLDYDVWIALLSLPKIFATTLENIPASVPYLFPESDQVARWRHRFNPKQLNIGIVWAGSRLNLNDSYRSCSLAHFAPLADLPNVAFYSLQTGKAALQPVPVGLPLTMFTEELTDFSDTAAVIACLDLVISVDTAVAHLAGALGKPVWLVLPSPIADWRWLTAREDSPWYPTMRLFRQPAEGDWEGVLAQVAKALAVGLGNEHREIPQTHD